MSEKTALNLEQVQSKLRNASALEALKWAVEQFGDRVALACSFGAEDVVLVDMLTRVNRKARVFTLDTGRLPQETYDVWDKLQKRYNLHIDVFAPDQGALEDFVAAEGPNAFYKSVAMRKECCRIRKILPLREALGRLDAWVCGLRREQSVTRAHVEKVEIDTANGNIYKINPLADWTEKQVWDYIQENNVPYNPLHDRNYPSIGCAPCTRAIKPGEDVRAGRWWWESPETKECGLHAKEPVAPKASAKGALEKQHRSPASGSSASLLGRLFRGFRWLLEPTFV
jgi:phosphoadenosine phosphosulfate reductase